MTAPLAILVKSYAGDLPYADRLLASIERHNVDGIPVFLVVPDTEMGDFSAIARGASVLPESMFARHLVTESVGGITPGYMNQEIIKLCFWEAGLCENWLCMDSDAEFVRDFTTADFMASLTVPFTFATEDAELRAEPGYYRDHWIHRLPRLEQIRDAIGYTGRFPLTVHGHAVFSAEALRTFVAEFLEPRGWDYKDALALSPYEPTWYTTWVLHRQPIPIVLREPIVKTFHNATQHLEYVLRGVTEEDVARGYVAVVVNANFSRGEGVVPLVESRSSALASYVSVPDLLRAMGSRAFQQIVVQRTPFRRGRVAAGRLALRLPGLRRLVDTGAADTP